MVTTAIIVPAHNEERFLPGLLKSVSQFGPQGAEVIVVDNGSTDSTASVAAAFGAKVMRLERCFPGAARNRGAALSSADVFVFLDADVELTPDWQAAWSNASMDSRCIFGAPYDVSKAPSWIERAWFAPMRRRRTRYIPGGNLIVGRELFERLEGFDERLETGEDVDLCRRATMAGSAVTLVDGLRVHHEGFPRTIGGFLRRERWHGRGDYATVRRALSSKVVLASCAFVALNLAALLSAIYGASGDSWWPTVASAVGVLGLCLLAALRATGALRLQALPLAYTYYAGRFLSMFDGALRARHR